MPVLAETDATWVNSTPSGITFDETELRLADLTAFAGDGTGLGTRGGVVYQGDTSLAISVNASDVVTVQPGAAVIPGNHVANTGPYRTALGAATNVALGARNATNGRIDRVVYRMRNTAINAALPGYRAQIDIITGTPAGTPAAPALPTMAIHLGFINVPNTAGGNATVDVADRMFVSMLGGDMIVPTFAKLPTTGIAKWQRARLLDSGIAYMWTGSAWLGEGIWQSYTPTYPGFNAGTGATFAGRYAMVGKTVHFRARIQLGTGFTIGNGAGVSLPVTANVTPAGNPHLNSAMGSSGVNVWFGFGTLFAAQASLAPFGGNGIGAAIGPTFPFTWKATDTIELSGTYEAL